MENYFMSGEVFHNFPTEVFRLNLLVGDRPLDNPLSRRSASAPFFAPVRCWDCTGFDKDACVTELSYY